MCPPPDLPDRHAAAAAAAAATQQGAARGLAEELGIQVDAADLAGPLAPTHRRELHQGDFHDCELVQSYRSVF